MSCVDGSRYDIYEAFLTLNVARQQASKRGAPAESWLEQMLARKPRMLVTVALANKTARIICALLMSKEDYKAPVAAAA